MQQRHAAAAGFAGECGNFYNYYPQLYVYTMRDPQAEMGIGRSREAPPYPHHRLCIRKADEVWGKAARDDSLADTRFCRIRTAVTEKLVGEVVVCGGLSSPGVGMGMRRL
jgi:hypothetical protein